MAKLKQVRLGLIGVGGMGMQHLRRIKALDRIELVMVCDGDAARAQKAADEAGCEAVTDYRKVLSRDVCDAVMIATPHYSHTVIGIAALNAGLHVLVEKPISVHKADCEKLIAAHKNKKQVFAVMFNMRTDPKYIELKQLIDGGELGKLVRVNWIATDSFRTEAYYASGTWRATWAGEGGGVLLNQSPHYLDLLQWLCGMPTKVRAFCGLGKYHKIEVEDEVTAYLEYANGATGVFIASTGEYPGTNRLEIMGERGRAVLEGGKLEFVRNEAETTEFSRTTKEEWGQPGSRQVAIPLNGTATQHTGIIENFANAILDGADLIAPAAEGIHSVELANAMLYSSLTNKTVEIPLDGKAYERCLKELIKQSKHSKK